MLIRLQKDNHDEGPDKGNKKTRRARDPRSRFLATRAEKAGEGWNLRHQTKHYKPNLVRSIEPESPATVIARCVTLT